MSRDLSNALSFCIFFLMELALLFLNSFIIGFSGAMMPGPLLAIGIAETPKNGWLTGPIISTGHAIAEIVVVVILALGAAALVDSPEVTRGIAIVGGMALLLMGGSMGWGTIKKKVTYDSAAETSLTHSRLTSKGITATIANPYWFVWWGTVGLALLVQSQRFGIIGPVIFYFGHILSDFVWYTAVSLLIWKGRKLVIGRGMKFLLLSCAFFLIYLGISFIYHGWTGAILL